VQNCRITTLKGVFDAANCVKCYNHPDRDAIGTCSVCGQGICDSCSVKVGGKLYCKNDVERGLLSVSALQPPRSAATSATSIFFLVFAVFAFVTGLALIYISGNFASYSNIINTALGSYSSIALIANRISDLLLYLGILSFPIAALYTFAGYWLWKSARKGAVLGMFLSAAAIAGYMVLAEVPVLGWYVGVAGCIVYIFVLYMLLKAWTDSR
jgi:hypothetical protein